MFIQLVEAIFYMHKHKLVCHRDLKPENFLIDSNFDLQIADFGFCSEILTHIQQDQIRKSLIGSLNNTQTKTKIHYTCRGTLSYMAPEILEPSNGYNPEQTDVFSLGVILFSMYLGKPPFRQANARKDELFKMLSEYKYSKFWSIWEE